MLVKSRVVENDDYAVEVVDLLDNVGYFVYPKLETASGETVAPRLFKSYENNKQINLGAHMMVYEKFDNQTYNDVVQIARRRLQKEGREKKSYNEAVTHYMWGEHVIYTVQKISAGKYMVICSGKETDAYSFVIEVKVNECVLINIISTNQVEGPIVTEVL